MNGPGGSLGSGGKAGMTQVDWGKAQAHEAHPGAPARQEAAPRQGSGSFMNIIGAVLSLALLAGLGVWGYKLAVRDVTGVPIVRALEGPMRIQPDDPGGETAAFQGFSVNDIPSEGQAQAPADRLELAPRNTRLQPEDIPANPNTQVSALIPDENAPDQIEVSAQADLLAENEQPLVDDLTQVTPISSNLTQEVVNQVVAALVLGPEIIAASAPGIASSPRPRLRPSDFSQRVSTTQAAQAAQAAIPDGTDGGDGAAASTPASLAVVEIAAADIPVGTRLVQLGAFDSPEVARSQWAALSVRFEDYMAGKTRVIQQASSGGKDFYRLRALGFDDHSQARRFCAVLMADRAACIPVVTR